MGPESFDGADQAAGLMLIMRQSVVKAITAMSDSIVVDPFLDCSVPQWFPKGL